MAARKRLFAWNVYSATALAIGLSAAVHIAIAGPSSWVFVTLLAAVLFTDLGFTLAERRRRKAAAKSPVPTMIRTPRIIELAAAEAHLAGLRASYKAGRTSGHPEDALWDIEDAERRVTRLRAGTD
ncbi:hypothetical protein [Arthrobacter sp. UYCo732]|uniref:hypothetical protein n=1 Tax=Arthrobacter sp. UYCo732 TaxID=3156336 RepID=UPI003390FED0